MAVAISHLQFMTGVRAAPVLVVNPYIQGCLVMGGTDKLMKVWNILSNDKGEGAKPEVSLVTSRDLRVVSSFLFSSHPNWMNTTLSTTFCSVQGKVFSAVFSPDCPLTIAATGSKAKMQIWDVGSNTDTWKTFGKKLVKASQALKEQTHGGVIGVICYKSSLSATQHVGWVLWFPDMRGFWTICSGQGLQLVHCASLLLQSGLRLSMDLYPQVWVTYPRVLAVAKVIPASPGKIDAGLPAQGVWYLHFWGLPLATRCPPQWLHKNCQCPLCPPPLCSPLPLSLSPKLLNNSALQSVLTNLAWLQGLLPFANNFRL